MRPNCGAVPPTTFIPVAEKSGLIGEIGQWVLERAWLDRQHWQGKRPGDNLSMWVNISARRARIRHLRRQCGSRPCRRSHLLTLEVTESVFVRDGVGVLLTCSTTSKTSGSCSLLTTSGPAHPALNYLKRLPIDILKIDGEFVKDLGNDLASSAYGDRCAARPRPWHVRRSRRCGDGRSTP